MLSSIFYKTISPLTIEPGKRLISISPGGLKGFYLFGICKYIQENYNLENYIFSGASAGAWNSLLLCYKGNIKDIESKILDDKIQKSNKLNEIENLMKTNILNNFKTNEFNLNQLFIGVTTFAGYKPETTIFTDFHSLEDALNCCIASSHIPLITGGFTNVYREVLAFDGGFSKYPYLSTHEPVLHITPSIWKEKDPSYVKRSSTTVIHEYTRLFLKESINFNEMIHRGYCDSEKNKEHLDKVLSIA
jgi:hypothetical protein